MDLLLHMQGMHDQLLTNQNSAEMTGVGQFE